MSSAERSLWAPAEFGVHLYWIPLGAGGVGFVRANGLVYEALMARRENRPRVALYRTALEVVTPEGRYTVETAWPIPDADTASRGVAVEGPVFSNRLGRFRPFRYEVRCWHEGVIPDAGHAAASPQLLSGNLDQAQLLLSLVADVPPFVWGRDELKTGEMWNSNSVVSWLLVRSGVTIETARPPAGGRAPGWNTGVVAADRASQP